MYKEKKMQRKKNEKNILLKKFKSLFDWDE
jgi:hypothetical protein